MYLGSLVWGGVEYGVMQKVQVQHALNSKLISCVTH